MTRYGFLIDQDTCIGCHACTVACKAEHSVPLGVNRTWVKYVEHGTFPETQRNFAVLRCNHCDAAPCITICPTGALFRRPDGIVDFDTRSCIGCKSCMNACPYDALYIDPEDHTAQKCNFCAHRVDVGLEPSCVIVCPTESIVTGDLDDPASRIAQLVAHNDVTVRAPEQGTRPKLFYKGAHPAAIEPLRTRIAGDGLMWADVSEHHPTLPPNGDDARTVYTTTHPMPWGGMVTAYLVTKSVAAGALMIGVLLVLLGHAGNQAAVGVLPPVMAGMFTFVTSVLLVADLKQPRRALYILTRPNWDSWLTRGLVVLVAYAAVSGAWFVAGLVEAPAAIKVLAVPAVLLGAATAGYTAFLFDQCEGRDLWQSRLVLPMLLAQAVISGASALLIAGVVVDLPDAAVVRAALAAGLAMFALLLSVELTTPDSGGHVGAAQHALTHGKYAPRFRAGVAVGILLAAALVVAGMGALAGIATLIGLTAFEDGFVRAGQSVPLS